MSNKDKINFDTDFLDQIAKEKPKEKPKTAGSKDPNWVFHDGNNKGKSPLSTKKENPAKVWMWGIGIVIGIGILSSLGSSGSSTSSSGNSSNNSSYGTPSSNDITSGSGQTYRCASYAYDRAMALRPSSATQSQIKSDSAAIDARTSSIALEKSRIENMYVDQESQYSIDSYNEAVDAYNLKNNRLKADITNWNAQNASFNAQIDTYNNYLDSNCTKE